MEWVRKIQGLWQKMAASTPVPPILGQPSQTLTNQPSSIEQAPPTDTPPTESIPAAPTPTTRAAAVGAGPAPADGDDDNYEDPDDYENNGVESDEEISGMIDDAIAGKPPRVVVQSVLTQIHFPPPPPPPQVDSTPEISAQV